MQHLLQDVNTPPADIDIENVSDDPTSAMPGGFTSTPRINKAIPGPSIPRNPSSDFVGPSVAVTRLLPNTFPEPVCSCYSFHPYLLACQYLQ